MIELDARIIDIISRTHDIKSFRFEASNDISFKAGQFFQVTIDVENEKQTKHFSFSNSPTEKGFIEFTKRITESSFSKALNNLKIGDKAHLKLPYGRFTFEGEYDKAAFLSGGIGITPLRSMIKYIADKKLPTDAVLIFGNKEEKDIIFKHDFDAIGSGNNNIKIVYTLTSSEIDDKCRLNKGYIDDAMIKCEIPDFKERTFFICGPLRMVQHLEDTLKNKLSIKNDRIKKENFTGY